jgi:hypothetical protein
LKKGIKDPNCTFIYLDDDCYVNIAGYFEEELKGDSLIFAENSEDWNAVWSRPWEKIQEDIEDEYSWGTIIRLKRNKSKKLERKSTDKKSPQTKATAVIVNQQKRLKLSPNETQDLNDQIYKNIQGLIDSGTCTQHEAYHMLAKESKNKLGHSLTAKAIEGRYNRHPDVQRDRRGKIGPTYRQSLPRGK